MSKLVRLYVGKTTIRYGINVKPAYFISDAHLGANIPGAEERGNILISFLEDIAHKASHLFIIGDLFDFWIEYKHAIRPEYFHVLYELRRLKKLGVELHYIAGNHDFAIGDFLTDTIGITIHHSGQFSITLQGKNLYICHGDGLLNSDNILRFIKGMLKNPLYQRIYKLLHPDLGISVAEVFSRTSRSQINFRHQDEDIREYRSIAKTILDKGADIVIFGHTHYPEIHTWNNKIYCNTGDWIHHFTYAVLENSKISLKKYRPQVLAFHQQ